MKTEKSCGAVVFRTHENKTQILLIRHYNGGHWAFPKGHVEKGETEEQTALREILEETGLSVQLDTGYRKVVTYSPRRDVIKDVVYFVALADDGIAVAQEGEISRVEEEQGPVAEHISLGHLMELAVPERVHLKNRSVHAAGESSSVLSLIVNYRASAVFHRNVILWNPRKRNA